MRWIAVLTALCVLLSACQRRGPTTSQPEPAQPDSGRFVALGPLGGFAPASRLIGDAGASPAVGTETESAMGDSGVPTNTDTASPGSSSLADGGRPASQDLTIAPVFPSEPPDSGSTGNLPSQVVSEILTDAAPPEPALPDELEAYVAALEASGFAPCDKLVTAVRECCSRGLLFACDDRTHNCRCDGEAIYPAIGQLCSIEPSTPFSWACPEE